MKWLLIFIFMVPIVVASQMSSESFQTDTHIGSGDENAIIIPTDTVSSSSFKTTLGIFYPESQEETESSDGSTTTYVEDEPQNQTIVTNIIENVQNNTLIYVLIVLLLIVIYSTNKESVKKVFKKSKKHMEELE